MVVAKGSVDSTQGISLISAGIIGIVGVFLHCGAVSCYLGQAAQVVVLVLVGMGLAVYVYCLLGNLAVLVPGYVGSVQIIAAHANFPVAGFTKTVEGAGLGVGIRGYGFRQAVLGIAVYGVLP